jgi:uncharacterized protein with HEPN domain
MSDHVEKLQFILESLSIIEERMLLIKKDSDFVDSKNGLLILDAITMRLQAIGDSFNQIKKKNEELIDEQLQIDVDPIIGFRNFISHHYELLDYQIIYKICINDLPPLKKSVESYLNNLQN